MLEFLIDNMFVSFGGTLFKSKVLMEDTWEKDLYLCKAIIAINQMQEKNHNYQQRLQ
jgi:hypothetical protein